MKELTSTQEKVLQCIERSIAQRGYPPTRRELCTELRVSSTNGVADHIKALERKGYLECDQGKARGMRPVRKGREA